jgi:hypothetical protein
MYFDTKSYLKNNLTTLPYKPLILHASPYGHSLLPTYELWVGHIVT